MIRAKGIYDGSKIILLEPISLPPDTPVEVSIEEGITNPERAYWERLKLLGLLREVRPRPAAESEYEPIHAIGAPISQTILEERR